MSAGSRPRLKQIPRQAAGFVLLCAHFIWFAASWRTRRPLRSEVQLARPRIRIAVPTVESGPWLSQAVAASCGRWFRRSSRMWALDGGRTPGIHGNASFSWASFSASLRSAKRSAARRRLLLQRDGGVALAVGAYVAALAVALLLLVAKTDRFDALGLVDLAEFLGFGGEGVVGADGVLGAAGAVVAVGDGGHGGGKTVIGCRWAVVRLRRRGSGSWREGEFGRGVDVEVLGEAVFGGEIDGGGGDVRVIDAGLATCRRT